MESPDEEDMERASSNQSQRRSLGPLVSSPPGLSPNITIEAGISAVFRPLFPRAGVWFHTLYFSGRKVYENCHNDFRPESRPVFSRRIVSPESTIFSRLPSIYRKPGEYETKIGSMFLRKLPKLIPSEKWKCWPLSEPILSTNEEGMDVRRVSSGFQDR
jgi:hypothetical protein